MVNKMDTNKNFYTILYATLMVVVVAVVLAFASSLLKERQQRNIEIERKEMILRSVHLAAEGTALSKDKAGYIEAEYARYIKDSVITENGKELPINICSIESGERFYIIPLKGVGLWGPVWGYISLRDDMNTIYGAVFDHKSETPGLGAEITTPAFYKQFENKQIFDKDGNFVSVQVVKGLQQQGSLHKVDAISGGTITSKAVEEMLLKNLGDYTAFFKANLRDSYSLTADEDGNDELSDSDNQEEPFSDASPYSGYRQAPATARSAASSPSRPQDSSTAPGAATTPAITTPPADTTPANTNPPADTTKRPPTSSTTDTSVTGNARTIIFQ